MEAVFPVFLRLAGRAVLVVGGGSIATRKIEDLLESRAVVRVVSPVATREIEEWALAGRVALEVRGFDATDVEGAWLVISATNDPAVNRRVADACSAHASSSAPSTIPPARRCSSARWCAGRLS